MNEFIFSDNFEEYRIVIFRDKETRKFGFSIHEPLGENRWKTSSIIFHEAIFDNGTKPMRQAQALIECLKNNDIDYHFIKFGSENE